MIRALYFDDRTQFERHKHPGSFMIRDRHDGGKHELTFYCPCGCALESRLLVGSGFKPAGSRPSWRWNGTTSEPTLAPSVNMQGHWHGYLRDGYWESCA